MQETNYEKIFGVITTGEQKGFLKSIHYHRYEPTPYEAIEVLLRNYEVKSSDRIVDFGCGKGRLNFILHYLCSATVTGIEMNEAFYEAAVENKKRYISNTKRSGKAITFLCCLAEEYSIHPLDNKFYFFNPFTIQIFIKIINHILRSVEEHERDIDIILYYPSEEYIFYLENETTFELLKEIQLTELYPHNPNERFLVYTLKGTKWL